MRVPHFIGGSKIEDSTEVSYLGIAVTNNLNWNSHMNNETRSALNYLWSAKRQFATATRTAKLVAYVDLITPCREIACAVGTPTQEQTLISGSEFKDLLLGLYGTRRDSVTNILASLGLQPIGEGRKYIPFRLFFLPFP